MYSNGLAMKPRPDRIKYHLVAILVRRPKPRPGRHKRLPPPLSSYHAKSDRLMRLEMPWHWMSLRPLQRQRDCIDEACYRSGPH